MKGVHAWLSGRLPETPRWFLSALILLALTKLWLVSSQTLFAIGPAGHDDRLFLSLADRLYRLDWLGPYNELTLAKGPFYPIWIAVSYLLHIPLMLSQQLLYVSACVVATFAVKPLVRSLPWLVAIFALLLFNPISFDSHVATRVIRAGIYPALTLLSVATAIGLLMRHQWPLTRLIPWATACGLSVAAFWLTREEGVWLLAFLMPALAWTTFRLWRRPEPAWRKIGLCALPLLIPVVAVHLVSLVNEINYGVYAAVDVKTPEFQAAYGALSRVRHDHWIARIPVPKETRQRIYEQSPAFAELKPYFERRGFWTLRARGTKRHPAGLDEIAGGWFMWALRAAVAEAGYYRSGSTSTAYYRRLAREIDTACEERRLDCLPERASMMPPWRTDYVEPVTDAFVRGLKMLVSLEPLRITPIPSIGSDQSLQLFRRMSREQLSPQRIAEAGRPIFVRALAAHASAPLSVALIDAEGQVLANAEAKPSPEVESYFTQQGLPVPPYAGQARFELRSRCKTGCRLQVEAQGSVLVQVPLRKGRTTWFDDPLWIYIDDVRDPAPLSARTPLDKLKLKVLAQIGNAYQIGLPWLVALAFLAYGLRTWEMVRSRTIDDALVISSLLVAAVVGRTLILSLIHAMAFSAINTTYMAPAFPLLMLTVALMLTSPGIGGKARKAAEVDPAS